MPPDLISSAANPVAKRIRSLAQRRTRDREGAYVVEGIAPVWHAVEAGADVETLVVSPGLIAGSPATRMIADAERQGTPVVRLTTELFVRLSARDGPAGLAAIVRKRSDRLADLDVSGPAYAVVVHEVANPGNLGTIVRAADALGARGVIVSGNSADPFAPQAVKASMGSLFGLPVVPAADLATVYDWARDRGVATVATSAHAPTPLADAPLTWPMLVVLGSERTGLPPEALARSTMTVRIPMSGRVSSLNLAVAAGIVLHEVRRRRDD